MSQSIFMKKILLLLVLCSISIGGFSQINSFKTWDDVARFIAPSKTFYGRGRWFEGHIEICLEKNEKVGLPELIVYIEGRRLSELSFHRERTNDLNPRYARLYVWDNGEAYPLVIHLGSEYEKPHIYFETLKTRNFLGDIDRRLANDYGWAWYEPDISNDEAHIGVWTDDPYNGESSRPEPAKYYLTTSNSSAIKRMEIEKKKLEEKNRRIEEAKRAKAKKDAEIAAQEARKRDEMKTKLYAFNDTFLLRNAIWKNGENINEFINKNLKYPQDASEREENASFSIMAIVEKDGTLSNDTIIQQKSLDNNFKIEAYRILNLVKENTFIPAINQNNDTVRQIVSLDFSFNSKLYLKSKGIEPAYFEGGQEEISFWIKKNYVALNLSSNNIDETVYLSAYVDEKGKLFDIQIANTTNEKFNKKAIKYAKKMPKWIPEKCNGAIRKSTIPVHFHFHFFQEPYRYERSSRNIYSVRNR